jgi:sialate O-acetylesterase
MDGIREVEAFSAADGIIINSDKKPDFIYYGWKPFSDGNLVNSENLPASTFKIKVK